MGSGKSREEQVKEKARDWQRQIRSECRRLDRDLAKIRNEETKLKSEIKTMAKKGQPQSVQTLAKQVVRSRKAQNRLEKTKCSLNAVNLHLTTTIATMSTASSIKMSAGVMKEMNALMRVPELSSFMQDMQREMARAEIIDELIEESFDDQSDDEAEVDTEVMKVLDELSLDTSALMATSTVPTAMPAQPAAAAAAPATEVPADDPLMARLQALQK